jgi:hypothetical protein
VTPLILLVLVGLWIVVLAPAALKRLFDRRPTASIESFHQSLDLLQRTGPKIVPAAYRLQTANSGTGLAPCESGFPAVSSMPGRPNLVLLPPVDDDIRILGPVGATSTRPEAVEPDAPEYQYEYDHQWAESDMAYGEPRPVRRPGPDVLRRHRTRVRRRNLIGLLTVNLVVTAPLGALGGLHLLWIVTALSGVALAGFLGLVAYARALSAQDRRFDNLRVGRHSPRAIRAFEAAREQPVLSRGIAVQYTFDDFDSEVVRAAVAR